MYFSRLEVTGLRNLRDIKVDLDPKLNLFHGENGAGKTALLESVHTLCRGRSFRTSRTRELINKQEDHLLVRGDLVTDTGRLLSMGIRRDMDGSHELRVAGEVQKKTSAASRLVPLQVLLPDVSNLVLAGPSERRRFLDWGVFHVKQTYLELHRDYHQVLKQRNRLLKENRQKGQAEQSSAELESWTNQLAELGERLTDQRVEYVQTLVPEFDEIMAHLAPEISLQVKLLKGWDDSFNLAKTLGEMVLRDVKLGVTHAGAHRADLAITQDGQNVSLVLSRGQAKTVAIGLMLAQAQLLKKQMDTPSLFLIDDIGAELDEHHNRLLFDCLDGLGCQILATSTGVGLFGRTCKVFHVKHGEIETNS